QHLLFFKAHKNLKHIFSCPQVFHLRDIRWERPRFLSKSFLAFVTFNFISYSLLAAEVLTTNVAGTSPKEKSFYQHVFNGCYAVLLFIVVTFFLIYGVEVYFKLRGEFLKETKGIQTDLAADGSVDPRSVDVSQLHQVPVVSRNWHDLVFRLAEIGVALWFPCVLWNSMAPERLWLLNPRRLLARQLDDARLADLLAQHHDAKNLVESHRLSWTERAQLVVRVVSLCRCIVARTILSVLKPQLAIKNSAEDPNDTVLDLPDRLGPPFYKNQCNIYKPTIGLQQNVETDSLVGSVGSARDCWICYDSSRSEPLIRPCRCTGDVSAVHHDCLSRWLVESAASPDGLKCKVCNTPYIVQETNRVVWERGFTVAHWARTALAVACMCAAGAAAWVCVQLAASPVARVLAAGAALLVCYVAIRFLGMNTVSAYQRAKVSSLRILTEPLTEITGQNDQGQLSTISNTVTVEIASKVVLERALKGEVNK
ncbi:hypothetical protein SFRURICE_021538, partial [Spodoptera frugiperda]